MSEIRNLPWGERHLCGDLYTIKISLGLDMYNSTAVKFKALGLTVVQLAPSKKYLKQRYLAYGVLKTTDFYKYLTVKNEAQAKLLIDKAAALLDQVRNRKEVIEHHEKTEGVRVVEPVTFC